jgi:hypothetical protein
VAYYSIVVDSADLVDKKAVVLDLYNDWDPIVQAAVLVQVVLKAVVRFPIAVVYLVEVDIVLCIVQNYFAIHHTFEVFVDTANMVAVLL